MKCHRVRSDIVNFDYVVDSGDDHVVVIKGLEFWGFCCIPWNGKGLCYK